MLRYFTVNCSYDSKIRANFNWGSILHGYLFSRLPESSREQLHAMSLRPFSQHVRNCTDTSLQWVIGAWNDELGDQIASALKTDSIKLDHNNVTLNVDEVNDRFMSERKYADNFFLAKTPCRMYQIEFETPCSHKSDGDYVIFPAVDLICNSLFMRFSSFSSELSIDDAQAIKELARHVKITRYDLRTTQFYLENTRITGYKGNICLYISGPDQLARLAGMLLGFSKYAGIGIKTSLGMGGCSITEIEKSAAAKQ